MSESNLKEENKRLRYHLTELAKFADRAAMVLVTLDPEDATEGAQLQEIIDGIYKWAPDAMFANFVVGHHE